MFVRIFCLFLLCLSVRPLFAEALVARWTVSAEGDTVVVDAGPHELHPEVTGSARREVMDGVPVVRFGPDQGQLVVPASNAVDRAVAGLTLSARVRLDKRPGKGGVATLVTKRANWYEPAPYVLSIGDDGALVFEGHNGSDWIRARSKPGVVKTGVEQVLGFTYEVGEGLRLYVDGKPVASKGAKQPLQRNGANLRLGYEQGSQHVHRRVFEGALSDVRLYAAPLNAAQMLADSQGEPVRDVEPYVYRPGASEPAFVNEDGRLEASIVFDREPRERGMVFSRIRVQPEEVTVEGETVSAWKVQGGSAPDMLWVRSLYLTLTDPRFRLGEQPAVDVEITYLFDAQAGFDVYADTEDGSDRVGGTWGASSKWRTLRFQIDDAFFGSREHGSKEGTNGVDLRVNAVNADWYIREVRVLGNDLIENPDFSRLLRVQSVTHPERQVFFFPRGEAGRIDYEVANLAKIPFHGTARFTLFAHGGGRVIDRTEEKVTLLAENAQVLTHTFDTGELPFGVYETRLELVRDGSEAPALSREGSVAVGSDTVLRKARDGEFWYGLDPSLGSAAGSSALMAWIELMGADIVREGIGRGSRERDLVNFRRLREAGLRINAVIDVPRQENREEFDRELARTAAFAAEAASELRVEAWEIGNEPDLPFFFPVGMERYLDGYYVMYEAIKAADPETMVLNGGLANASHSEESLRRTRIFFEQIDPGRIDRVAYHAHGPGAAAERNALRRVRELAAEFGKGQLRFLDTETGVAARSPAQEIMQASTLVQKFAYVQSQDHPYMLWFRLRFEQPRSYGNLHTPREPRPAVSAYRAMVEALRGYRFHSLPALDSRGVEAYLFEEIGGDGRALVVWSDERQGRDLTLRLAAPGGELHDVEQRDLFGNTVEGLRASDGRVTLTARPEPAYLLWTAADPGFEIREAAPLLEPSALAELVPGSTRTARVTVRNDSAKEAELTLEVAVESPLDIRVAPAEQTVTLAAGERRSLPVEVATPPRDLGYTWPDTWRLYAPVPESLTPAADGAPPETLAGEPGRTVFFENNTLVFGGAKERRAGVLIGVIDSDREQSVTIGASADWWMEWRVNGEVVYSTLDSGNGGGFRITDHVFDLPLKAGANLVSVKVLSGSQGWKLVLGDPEEVRAAREAGDPRHRFMVGLRRGGDVLAQRQVPVRFVDGLPAWSRETFEEGDFTGRKPLALLGEGEVENPFLVEPDASRWWHGADDLSARLWMGALPEGVGLVVKVRDDRHEPGDQLEVAAAPAGGGELRWWTVEPDRRDGEAGVTWYRLEMPGTEQTLVNLRVVDHDGGIRKQTLTWRSGFDREDPNPVSWAPAVRTEGAE